MSFRITLTQGLNRQIRRMCEALGYHVTGLKRVRIMNIRLGNLKPATWRNVTPEELKTLEELLKQAKKTEKQQGGGKKTFESAAEYRKKTRSEKNYRVRQKEYFRKKQADREKKG